MFEQIQLVCVDKVRSKQKIQKNDILISIKTKKGEKQMNTQKVEDVKDTALKLDEIRICRPEDYFYSLFGIVYPVNKSQ